MFRSIFFLALSSWASLCFAGNQSATEKPLVIDKWRECGLITKFTPNLIPKNCLQSVYNMEYDADWALSRRNGYAQYNLTACTGSQAVRGLWPFYAIDGTKYLIAFSSGTMFSSKSDGTCTAITGLGGLSLTANMECVQSLGYLWCTDNVDPVFNTNVTTTNTITGAPIGQHIGAFRNRILIAGVPANQTQLYLSGELDGTNWALNLFPNVSTNPAIIPISGANDGLKINCLMGQYQNQYLIGRDYDLYSLSGYSNQDFSVRKISQEVGCIEPHSVQEVNNVLYWLSKRGVEGYTGTQINPVSYTITPTISQIITASGNSRSQTLTGQSTWQNGNLTASGPGAPISATINPGNLVVSTWGVSEISNSSWASGTMVNVSTDIGLISLAQGATASFVNAGAESNSQSINWNQPAGNGFAIVSDTSLYGAKAWKANASNTCPVQLNVNITDGSFNVLISSAILISNGQGSTIYTPSTVGLSTNTIRISVTNNGSGCTLCDSAVSVPFMAGTALTVKYKDGESSAQCADEWDLDETNIVTTGTYTTQRYNTGLSTPTWGLYSAPLSSSTLGPITLQTRVATTANGTLDAQVPDVNFSKILSAQKQYIVAIASFSVNSTTNAVPTITSISLTAETTGYYISQCIQVSTPTTWGNFNANAVSDGGSFTFYLATGANCGAAISPTTATWTTQGVNSQIVLTTATNYIGMRVLFGLDVATETPTLNNVTFNWNTGGNRPATAAVSYKDRYYLFYTTNTVGTAVNDHAAIYDFNQKWTLFDDIPAASAALYLNSLYFGDSNNTGLMYQLDTGQNDNGNAFTMSFQTADIDVESPEETKAFDYLYMILAAPNSNAGNTSISCNYFINGSTTAYSLGAVSLSEAPEGTGYFSAKMPFPQGQTTRANWINIACSYNGTTGPVELYSLRLYYKDLERP